MSYANAFALTNSETDFVLEFALVVPRAQPTDPTDEPAALSSRRLLARLALAPAQASRLARALTDAVRDYESEFGPIPLAADKPAGAEPEEKS